MLVVQQSPNGKEKEGVVSTEDGVHTVAQGEGMGTRLKIFSEVPIRT